MSTNTTRLAIPKPEDTDALSTAAGTVARATADKLDDLIPAKSRRGNVTGTTDASGDFTITHGLGGTPSAVIVSNGNSSSSVVLAVHTIGATTFKVRLRASTTAAVFASTAGMIVFWEAFI